VVSLLALVLHAFCALTFSAPVKRVDSTGNVLTAARARSSSSQPTFTASAVLDGLIRSDANGDNGLFFANDDRDQRLAIAGFKGPIREIRLLSNVGDLSRLPRTITIRASTRDMSGEPSLDVADYPVELVSDSPNYREPAGDPPDDQVFVAQFAVDVPADARALLFSFGDAGGAGDRISEIQAFADAPPFVRQGGPASRVVLSRDATRVIFLGWDTQVGTRANVNLLRRNAAVEVQGAPAARLGVDQSPGGADFDLTVLAPAATGDLKLVFPFSPATSVTTVIPARVTGDGVFHLPAIVSAPGYGQMLVTAPGVTEVTSRLVGNRGAKTVDWVVELPQPAASATRGFTLSFRPVTLPAPRRLNDDARWEKVRRAWFNTFQVTAAWGDPKNPFSAPSGVLGNNVISDPVSCCLFEYADSALWTPELAPGVSAMAAVGRTLDWWLGRMQPGGVIPGYWNHTHFLDANPSILIAAWDYVQATRDDVWLRERIERLEKVAEYLASRDVDNDGLIEAVQSGNAGTLVEPARSCSAYDAVNCGHKDGYCNALAYRAFRCLAELDSLLNRDEQAARFTKLADRLKAAYEPALFNPQSGLIAWWRSADGKLHDYESPFVNALAVEYGLVDQARGWKIVRRLRDRMRDRGFKRFDLGIPCTLLPVRREDYLLPAAPGLGTREDGSDQFGNYLNGGVLPGDAVRYIAACYTVGETALGDECLDAMLDRLGRFDVFNDGFPFGVVDRYPDGGEFFTWSGKTCG
jgi:hypothetical protein